VTMVVATDLGLEVFDEFLDLRSAVTGAVIGHSSDGHRVKPHRLCMEGPSILSTLVEIK
jgi:hypothetical protein